MSSVVNTLVKPFKAHAFHNGKFCQITERDLFDKWSVFVFYPADFSFICPTELGDIADHYEDFKSLGVEVYSISTDSHFSHKAWHDTSDSIKKVKFPMLSDPVGRIAKNFDVLFEEEGIALRATFIIDPKTIILTADISHLSIGRSATELLRKVQAAQYVSTHGKEVCPANWHPGDATICPTVDSIGKI